MSDQPTIRVQKLSYLLPVTAELLQQAEDDRKAAAEARARWEAMTPEEQHRAQAEWEAQQAADKAARTCEHCGCDPEEHGTY